MAFENNNTALYLKACVKTTKNIKLVIENTLGVAKLCNWGDRHVAQVAYLSDVRGA